MKLDEVVVHIEYYNILQVLSNSDEKQNVLCITDGPSVHPLRAGEFGLN